EGVLGATPRGQPWTSAVPLPLGRNGMSVWRMAVLWTFRAPALCRHVHRELLRRVLRDVTPIRVATAYHQRNDVERYSRVRHGVERVPSAPGACPHVACLRHRGGVVRLSAAHGPGSQGGGGVSSSAAIALASSSVSTRAMKASNSSRVAQCTAWPDSTCSTRPNSRSCASGAAACTCTTNARCPGSGWASAGWDFIVPLILV